MLPAHQGRGIGSERVRRVLAGTERFYSIDLRCDEELLPYDARFGMVSLTGATLRHREALTTREKPKAT